MEELSASVLNWANITHDLLRFIADKTRSVKDLVRMTAACRSWQASLVDKKLNFPVCLKLAEGGDIDKRCFYGTSDEMFELNLPEIRGRRCWGSPFGWLVTCRLDLEIHLFHPLSRATLPLPSLRTFHDYNKDTWTDRTPEELCEIFLEKLILSSSPESSQSDCIVLAIYSFCFLAFAKPGDQAWTQICTIPVVDAIYFKGNVYAVDRTGMIFLCQDLYGSHPKAVQISPSCPASPCHRKYIFDLDGNLCVADRRIIPIFYGEGGGNDDNGDSNDNSDDSDNVIVNSGDSGDNSDSGDGKNNSDNNDNSNNDNGGGESDGHDSNDSGSSDGDDSDNEDYIPICETVEFRIFKLDINTESLYEIFSLGHRSLFVGNSCTFTIPVADYPGCRSNGIYFTSDYSHYFDLIRIKDIGFYDCKNIPFDIYRRYKEGEDIKKYLQVLVEPFPNSKDVQHHLFSAFSHPFWIIL